MPKLTDGMQGGPVVVFDPHGNTLVVSPFSQFMAASMTYVNNTLSWGIMGEVDSVPNMYSVQTIMYYSSEGINKVGRSSNAFHVLLTHLWSLYYMNQCGLLRRKVNVK